MPQTQILSSEQSIQHLDLAARRTFLIGRRRLVNRRIDWLLNLLTTAVANQYILRLERQAACISFHMRAHSAMSAALLKAKGKDSNEVTMANDHTASVQSRSDKQLYTVACHKRRAQKHLPARVRQACMARCAGMWPKSSSC